MIYAHSEIFEIQQFSYKFISSIFNRLLCAKTYSRADIMLMKEHPIYTNYLITTNSDVISKNYHRTGKKRLLKQDINQGYKRVVLTKNKKTYRKKVHRLVAETFIPNPENKPCVNHIDGNKLNNNVNNIEWCTYSENSKHAFKIGLIKPYSHWLGKFGKDHNRSKKVEQIDSKTNKIIKIWNSLADIKRALKVNPSLICDVCKFKKNEVYGFKWKYYKKNEPKTTINVQEI